MAAEDTSAAGASSNSIESSSSSSSSSSNYFHDRKGESKALEDHCSSKPTAISVILGPRSAGKTALLKEYMRDRGLADSRCFIDARATPISTPSDLACVLIQSAVPKVCQTLFPDVQGVSELAKLLTPVLSAVQDKLKLPGGIEITVNGKAIAPILQALAGNTEEVPSLATVIKAYIALLDAWDKARAAGLQTVASPVLILDEANVLMSWSDQYQTERQDLLRFFLSISKEQRRSHVVLATSEYSFQAWLTKELGGGAPFFNTFVVGDFPEKEARAFLNKCLQQSVQSEVSDDNWKTVYQACGGNAGALNGAAHFYHTLGSWQKALTQLAKDVWLTMEPGYAPAADAGYTAADYATAVKDILGHKHNAVNKKQLMAKLGKQSLDAMVQANLLALRPYSSWAADINVEAFGPEQLFTVVTAPSTLHLYLMERQRDLLLEPLDDVQAPAQGNADSSTSSGRPGSPTSDALKAVGDDIKAVQGKIQGVEGQIEEISNEISALRKAKGEGWQDELACLQQDKQQLVEKERQLRDEKKVLQDQKLLLMKREE